MNFDLDIENYNKEELIEMFELPPNFDKNIVEIKESKLKDSIFNNKQINKDTQIKTINFLAKAKNIILNEKNKPLQKKIEDFYNTSYELKSTIINDPSEHMVQIRDNKPYLSSYPSEFFPGVINPLKKRTIKKNLNIDTRFRDNYYSSPSTNFNLSLPINIDNVLQMQLNAIELPISFYSVSKQYSNNYFQINVNGNFTIIQIQDGNYSPLSITTYINNQLSNAGAPFSYVSFDVNIFDPATGSGQTIVAPNGMGAVTIIELYFNLDKNSYNGNTTLINDINTPLPLKLGWILGFRNGSYVGNLNYISEGIVDTSGPKYLYLVVDDYNNNVNNSFYSAFNSSILNKNILARISLQSDAFSILQQNNLNIVTNPREYFGPVNLQTMNIQLLDEYGRIVDLNNMDYSFCLSLITVYDL